MQVDCIHYIRARQPCKNYVSDPALSCINTIVQSSIVLNYRSQTPINRTPCSGITHALQERRWERPGYCSPQASQTILQS